MLAQHPDFAALHTLRSIIGHLDILNLRIVSLRLQRGGKLIHIILRPAQSIETAHIRQQSGKRLVIVAAQVGETIVGQHDLRRLVIIHIDRGRLNRLPTELLRRQIRVIAGENLVIVGGVRADVDHDGPILAARLQRFGDGIHIAAPRILVIRAQVGDFERLHLQIRHDGSVPARARWGGQIRRERNSGHAGRVPPVAGFGILPPLPVVGQALNASMNALTPLVSRLVND
jgi:hypothetical protein